MSRRIGPVLATTSIAALLWCGSAAGAAPSRVAGPAHRARQASGPHVLGRVSLRPVSGTAFPDPASPTARRGPTSNDSFRRLVPGAFAAYATGTVFHTDPELTGTKVAATVDMATADAVYAGQPVSAFADELGRSLVTDLPAGSGQAQARAVKVDPPDAVGDVDTGEPAEAKAPPTGQPVVHESTANLTPLVRADALRSEAAARAVSTGCVIGNDLARGVADADDTDVADTNPSGSSTKPLLSLSADDPPRAVSQSVSHTRLVPIPGRPGRFGAMAEVRQTIAPITFGLPGTDEKFTIEVAGEWVMRAVADGTTGSVTFGSEKRNDNDRPALRLIHGKQVVDETGLRDLGGREGIFVDGQPVGDIRIGGDRRAVGGPPTSTAIETGTLVSAAADAVVVRLFEPYAELRVGHMEVGLVVPPGGVQCPGITVTKTSEPRSVRPGVQFSWNIDVSNPNDCDLDKVQVIDTPASTAAVAWKPVSSLPRATQSPDGSLVFDAFGPLGTGQTKTLELNAEVEPGSAPGTITNRAVATGACADAPMRGDGQTTTAVGTGLVPAVPAPAGEVGGTGPGSPTASSAAAEGASGPEGGSSPSPVTRSASAVALGESTTRPAATGGASDTARTAGALPRSGADALPTVALGLTLLGSGRAFRRVRPRR